MYSEALPDCLLISNHLPNLEHLTVADGLVNKQLIPNQINQQALPQHRTIKRLELYSFSPSTTIELDIMANNFTNLEELCIDDRITYVDSNSWCDRDFHALYAGNLFRFIFHLPIYRISLRGT